LLPSQTIYTWKYIISTVSNGIFLSNPDFLVLEGGPSMEHVKVFHEHTH